MPFAALPAGDGADHKPARVLAHVEATHGGTVRNQAHVMPYLDRYIDVWAAPIKEGKVAASVEISADGAKLELVSANRDLTLERIDSSDSGSS
ncbi:hypothetical protein HK101_011892, partial [Irineochytrium annulatum]